MMAVIYLDVPDWQIGQEVSVYFPDTMMKKAVCGAAQIETVPILSDDGRLYCDACGYEVYNGDNACWHCKRQIDWNK